MTKRAKVAKVVIYDSPLFPQHGIPGIRLSPLESILSVIIREVYPVLSNLSTFFRLPSSGNPVIFLEEQ